MDHFKRTNLLLSLPIMAVELATLTNLAGYYHYHELLFAALLLAGAFSALLISTALLISQDLNWPVRALLVLGGLALFFVQSIANVSEAYLRAEQLLPAAQLARLWHTSTASWLAQSSFIFGGAVNLAGAIYWIALGQYFRTDRQHQAHVSAVLDDLLAGR